MKDHQIDKWKYQKYWINFGNFNKKPGISKHWQSIENKCRSYKTSAAKFKKFNNLKYKLQPIKEQKPAITQANFKKSYANTVKGGTNIIDPKVQHLRKTSKRNIGKVGITTSRSWTTPPLEIANKSPFNYKANINR